MPLVLFATCREPEPSRRHSSRLCPGFAGFLRAGVPPRAYVGSLPQSFAEVQFAYEACTRPDVRLFLVRRISRRPPRRPISRLSPVFFVSRRLFVRPNGGFHPFLRLSAAFQKLRGCRATPAHRHQQTSPSDACFPWCRRKFSDNSRDMVRLSPGSKTTIVKSFLRKFMKFGHYWFLSFRMANLRNEYTPDFVHETFGPGFVGQE